MVYSPTGSLDLFLILGCMTSNFLYLSFSTLYSSSLWRTDTIVFSKLSQPPLKYAPYLTWQVEGGALTVFSINRPGRLLNFWTLTVGAYSR